MTLESLCVNTCNSSNIVWYLLGRRNVKGLITSFLNTGIDVCKYFEQSLKKALTLNSKNSMYS